MLYMVILRNVKVRAEKRVMNIASYGSLHILIVEIVHSICMSELCTFVKLFDASLVWYYFRIVIIISTKY